MVKKIVFFSGSRSEYGLQLPIIKAVSEAKELDYFLIVSGSHLQKDFGSTIAEIKDDGLVIGKTVDISNNEKPPESMAISMGTAINKITEIIKSLRPDIFCVYGDRYETFSAAIASTQNNIITAHIEGGDLTEGGTHDDNTRHAITKLSHLHFATNKESYKRILAMGEEKWRVHLVGYPALDLINNGDFAKVADLESELKVSLNKPLIVFTQHSISNDFKSVDKQIVTSIKAIENFINKYDASCVITFPNNDAGGSQIINLLKEFDLKTENVRLVKSLGRYKYWGLLNLAKNNKYKVVCMGNSSSGIKETPAFGCPTVNIGTRQNGRMQGDNVINCNYDEAEIYNALEKSIFDKEFRMICKLAKNPYDIGNAAKNITKIFSSLNVKKNILTKKMTI